mgnify:FL=1
MNSNPALVFTTLDKFYYGLELETRSFATNITVTADPTILDYRAQGYLGTPSISLTPVLSSALRINNTHPALLFANATQANISVYTNAAAFISGIVVNVSMLGY